MSINSKMTAIADEIRELSGKTGTMGLDAMATNLGEANDEVGSQTTLIAQIISALDGKAAAGGSGEQITPTISVSSSGLITATAGTKSATKQLTTQAAKTITPSANSQTAVSSGVYTTGTVTVAAIPSTYVQPSYTKSATTYIPTTTNKTISAGTYLTGSQTIQGDSNLVAGNIKNGVNIFGVSGTYVGSGGSGESGSSDNENDILDRSITSYTNDSLTTVGMYAFYSCTQLTAVSFANATGIRNCAFSYCSRLTTADFPKVTNISASAFQNCHKLKTINAPDLVSIYSCAFNYCSSLTTASFPKAKIIGSYAFQQCYSLSTASLPSATTISNSAFRVCRNLSEFTVGTNNAAVCTLGNSNVFTSTPFAGYSSYFSGTPVIYVPASLLTSYQTATNWTYFSKYMVGI